jgi:hypothetical protein
MAGRLLSLHPTALKGSARWLDLSNEFDTSKTELMLDSGAFSAWTKGQGAIDVHWLLDQYREFDRKCAKRFKAVHFISLDIIPGSPGERPTHDEIADAVRRSDDNHKVLQDAFGDRVIPVYHQEESSDRLAELQEINPSYVCISPQNGIIEEDRYEWARDVHAKLNGTINTHGLATTGGEMMETIDWRSVDSSTWVKTAAYGGIKIEWKGRLTTLLISEDSLARGKSLAHFDTLADDDDRLKMVGEIRDELGITPHMLRTRDTYRYLFNAHVMTEWSKRPHAREALA